MIVVGIVKSISQNGDKWICIAEKIEHILTLEEAADTLTDIVF